MAAVPSKSILNQEDFPKGLDKPEEFLPWIYEIQKDYMNENFVNNRSVQWLFDDYLFSPQWQFTDQKYATHADAWHMNEYYGVEILNKINSKIQNLEG
ncbi:hypothetical protein [Alteromonas halophila]|uniref:Uncharacterized protein n=1 Tax=Alteromonas halophila TaxID=516698 RepID=A0A918JJV3_9ALTE|nr:hypothetical protein [Alteromonas halophila]GGW82330.1 hypothetical protein GCM10007391_14210 [Alteromonas halophila]